MNDNQTGIYICYFAVPYNFKKDSTLYLWAKDRADNETKKTFFYHIRRKRFRSDKIGISDRLLNDVISSFPPGIFEPGKSKIEKYLYVNRELREQNRARLRGLCQSPSREKLWDGPWLRMKNAATMAKFADQRIYYYKGKLIGRGVHLGVDLASLARSPVQAANSGRVIHAGDLGIYGLTVVIDHGQGLYTMYGHLSKIDVDVDQSVTKGDTIGTTGNTGLATGDHLHFAFMVHGVAVNPIEWWDSHWIRDNIYRKLDTLNKLTEK
ncbi:MAG: M23 family metallopeptidase [Desulfobacterales bacterium]|nr:M23 family metallopeptidase [Desulfobacterales bacterium]